MYSILIPTYCNPEYLKLCINSIFENSYYGTHQLCIHVNGYDQETIDYLDSNNLKYTVSKDNIGIPLGLDSCLNQAAYDNIFLGSDDYYFTKNWDYYLHQWETEMNSKFPDYIKIIGYRRCEPTPGSFPPICNAGKNIKEFNVDDLNRYISENSIHDIGEWDFNSLYPKDIFAKYRYSYEFYPTSCCDLDFMMRILKYLKDNNIKFLIFSVKDCYVYHFQRIATLKSKIPNIDNAGLFRHKWGIDTGEGFNLIHEEVKRSISLIKGRPQ